MVWVFHTKRKRDSGADRACAAKFKIKISIMILMILEDLMMNLQNNKKTTKDLLYIAK